MVGITQSVDREATLAFLQSNLLDLPKEVKQLVEIEDVANNIKLANLTVESISPGSIRPNCRLAKSRNIPARCRCGKERED